MCARSKVVNPYLLRKVKDLEAQIEDIELKMRQMKEMEMVEKMREMKEMEMVYGSTTTF